MSTSSSASTEAIKKALVCIGHNNGQRLMIDRSTIRDRERIAGIRTTKHAPTQRSVVYNLSKHIQEFITGSIARYQNTRGWTGNLTGY